jgi:uncharacterized membrane protein YkvI
MSVKWKNAVRMAFVYSGIMLGAGFVSGRELIEYFVRFGYVGLVGLFISGVILALISWAVLDICISLGARLKRPPSYEDFTVNVMGKHLSKTIDVAVTAFILILYGAMLSASGSLAKEAFDLPFTAGVLGMALICLVTFRFGLKAIIRINTVLTPVFIIGGIFFILYTLSSSATPTFASPFRPLRSFWVWAAVVYASFNVITSVSMLVRMHPMAENKKTAKAAGLLGGGIITAMGVLFALPLLFNFTFLPNFEMPLLALAINHGVFIEFLYVILIFSAIYTTAAANGFAVASRFPFKGADIAVTLIAVMLAFVGFSSLIANVYPIFGYIGLFKIIIILIYFTFMREK